MGRSPTLPGLIMIFFILLAVVFAFTEKLILSMMCLAMCNGAASFLIAEWLSENWIRDRED